MIKHKPRIAFKIDDTLWEVKGKDCLIGSRVEIISTDDSSFRVALLD
ncbi:MAG: hypothetical protein KAU26_09000 [Methylococcales bacterium]|nr:hypothetical protein [Methylococcales bacterium]